jgi:hypothetical protein
MDMKQNGQHEGVILLRPKNKKRKLVQRRFQGSLLKGDFLFDVRCDALHIIRFSHLLLSCEWGARVV